MPKESKPIRTQELWKRFCAAPTKENQEVLLRRAEEWALSVLARQSKTLELSESQSLCDQDVRTIVAEVLEYLKAHTFALDSSLNAGERLHFFSPPEKEYTSPLEYYVKALTLYYWWRSESNNNTDQIQNAAKALVGALDGCLTESAYRELCRIRKLDPKDVTRQSCSHLQNDVIEAVGKAQDSLVKQWSKPICERETTTETTADKEGKPQNRYWESFPRTLAYARTAAMNKARDIQVKQPEPGDPTDMDRRPAPEKSDDNLDEQDYESLPKRLWWICCDVGTQLCKDPKIDFLTKKWVWLILGGVWHTRYVTEGEKEEDRLTRDQVPPGDETAWLYQKERFKQDFSKKNAVRDLLTRPIERILEQMELPEDRELIRNMRNLGWKLFINEGNTTAEEILLGLVKPSWPHGADVFPAIRPDGSAPSREGVAGWAKLVVGGK